MKAFTALLVLATSLLPGYAAAVSGKGVVLDSSNGLSQYGALASRGAHKEKDNWGNAVEKDRKKVTIRASKDDKDDISDDFLSAIKKANKGGMVHLKKGHSYVIGKKLDLTFLDDIYVKIDGELKVFVATKMKVFELTMISSPTTLSIGKPTIIIMTFRKVSRLLCGAASESSQYPLGFLY